LPTSQQFLQAMIAGSEAGQRRDQLQHERQAEADRNALGYAALNTRESLGQLRNQAVEGALNQRAGEFGQREARLGERENSLEENATNRLAFRQKQQDDLERYRTLLQGNKQAKITPGDEITSKMAMAAFEAGLRAESSTPGSGVQAIQSSRNILEGLAQKYQPDVADKTSDSGSVPSMGNAWAPPYPVYPAAQTMDQGSPILTAEPGSVGESIINPPPLGIPQRLGDIDNSSGAANAPQQQKIGRFTVIPK
jgi:hypothetical protein